MTEEIDLNKLAVVRYDENGPHAESEESLLVEYIHRYEKSVSEALKSITGGIVDVTPVRIPKQTLSGLTDGAHKIVYDAQIIGIVTGQEFLGDWVNIQSCYIVPKYRTQGIWKSTYQKYMTYVAHERKKKSFSMTLPFDPHVDIHDIAVADEMGFIPVGRTLFVTDKELSNVSPTNNITICQKLDDAYLDRMCNAYKDRVQTEKENVKINVKNLTKNRNSHVYGIQKDGELFGCMAIIAQKRYCRVSMISTEYSVDANDILYVIRLAAEKLKKECGCTMKLPYGIMVQTDFRDGYLPEFSVGKSMQITYLKTL